MTLNALYKRQHVSFEPQTHAAADIKPFRPRRRRLTDRRTPLVPMQKTRNFFGPRKALTSPPPLVYDFARI